MKKILIIGAGFSGAVIARVLAEHGFIIDLIDQRNHIAGNAFDYTNEVGIRVHKYGPHIFHTSNMKVVEWLSQFTSWTDYKHKVKALLSDGQHVTLPVNINTEKIVGKENIVDIFFRPYTKKMWGLHIEELDPSIMNRLPIRNDNNELYFPSDSFQALPSMGYTHMFENILDHSNIYLHLSTAYNKGMELNYFHTFNSMPIDEYFEFIHGELPYRSIRFHTFTIPIPSVLPTATVNFTHSAKFTRVTEWKKFPEHGDSEAFSTLTAEEPCDYKDNNMERYYPVKDLLGINIDRYKQYKRITPDNITFIGRCGQYAYLDMHQAVSSALAIANNFIKTT